ncbi:enoyl-CoA hydratase/isomerase family protein [Thermaerobacillus caldiproteolyticus]|uniref:enoyl-CoA hydratase/isomerase family protein n=1 Tax=Thermaerobacillus caldiproteolyticus TaxID=247480 RepID=UPI00188C3A70|nr:enoyl-CoA hydratase/isomerase family protein [Anoxybacillus caldiproteolyticus]QPA31949.1 enoyl-CoA hydratase/isomerase family protein [Anoxybacillus caldiproteolyticus]
MGAILLERDRNGIVWFTINRQEKRNAINYEVMDALQETIRMVEKSDEVKILVITGAGDQAFCSGGDLSEFHHLHAKEEAYHMLKKMGTILYSLLTVSKPTVALINGTAVGGGCELATACDFRYARKGAKVGFIQGKLGITTGWGGATMLFEKLPYTRALDILLRAEYMSVETMYEYGWVHSLLSGENITEECRKLLSPYLAQTVSVLRAYKRAAAEKWKNDEFRARFFSEVTRCSILWESEEHEEAVRAFLDKS